MDLMNRDDQDFSKNYTGYPVQEEPFEIGKAKSLIPVFNRGYKSIKADIYFVFPKGYRGKIIGAIICGEINPHVASVSYYIAKPYRGKGLAKEAQMAVMKALSQHDKGIHFMAQVMVDNRASIKVLRHNGFTSVGARLPTRNRHMINAPVPTFCRGPVIR